jgi:hypothetical protein
MATSSHDEIGATQPATAHCVLLGHGGNSGHPRCRRLWSNHYFGIGHTRIGNVEFEHDPVGWHNQLPNAGGGLDDPHAVGGGSHQDGDRACP